MSNILKKVNQSLVKQQETKTDTFKSYQFSKKNETFLRADDIIQIYDGLKKEADKKGAQIHIYGVHLTGTRNIKGFNEGLTTAEITDYFNNKLKGWQDFDRYTQIIITLKIPKQKTKHRF